MKRGYLGVMYHAGEFNYKLGDTGKQGDLMGGGLTGGYLLKLNRTLSLISRWASVAPMPSMRNTRLSTAYG